MNKLLDFEKRRTTLKEEISLLNVDMFCHYFEVIHNQKFILDDETVYLHYEFIKILQCTYNDTYILNTEDIVNTFNSLRMKYRKERGYNELHFALQ
jgi:hypothetical protein